MGNIDKRLSALEDASRASEPVHIEMVAVEPMTLAESQARPKARYQPGDVITRIELVPILPCAEILPFRSPAVG